MAYYLLQIAFTPDESALVLKAPQDRLDALRPTAEEFGGTIEDGWLAFGEYDMVLLLDMPDNTRAAAFAAEVSMENAVRTTKTTPLMTIGEERTAAHKPSVEATNDRPFLEDIVESNMTPQQIQELITPNLEYAAACAESAHHVIREMGVQETMPILDTAIANGVHFLQLAQHYLEGLHQQVRQSEASAPEEAAAE